MKSEDTMIAPPAPTPAAIPNPVPLEGGNGFLDAIDSALAADPGIVGRVEPVVTEVSAVKQPEQAKTSEPPETPEVKVEAKTEVSKEEEKLLAGLEFAPAEELDLDEKASAKWNELRAEVKATREQLVKAQELRDAEVKSLQERLQQYEPLVAAYNVEATPQYEEAVTKPLQTIMDAAEALATKYEIEPEDIFDALGEGGKKGEALMEEFADKMSRRDSIALFQLFSDAEKVFTTSHNLKNHAIEALKELDSQKEQVAKTQAAKEKAEFRASVGKVFDRLTKVTPDIGVKLEEVQKASEAQDFGTMSVFNKAYAVTAANMLPALVKGLVERDKQITKLKTDIGVLSGGKPRIGAGTTADLQGSGSALGAEVSFLDAVTKGLAEHGL